MKLNLSKRIIKAGDVVEVTWDAEEATHPRLVMHTGQRETTLAIPESGCKKFRLKGSKGQHWIGLRCIAGNQDKLIRRRILIYGKVQEHDAFEYVNPESRWSRFMDKCKRYWNNFTSEKKRLYAILLALISYQVLMSFHLFTISQILMTVLTFYIFWQVIRK